MTTHDRDNRNSSTSTACSCLRCSRKTLAFDQPKGTGTRHLESSTEFCATRLARGLGAQPLQERNRYDGRGATAIACAGSDEDQVSGTRNPASVPPPPQETLWQKYKLCLDAFKCQRWCLFAWPTSSFDVRDCWSYTSRVAWGNRAKYAFISGHKPACHETPRPCCRRCASQSSRNKCKGLFPQGVGAWTRACARGPGSWRCPTEAACSGTPERKLCCCRALMRKPAS